MSRPQTVECLAEVHRKGWALAENFELNAESWEALRVLERNGEIRIESSTVSATSTAKGTMSYASPRYVIASASDDVANS